ncbi:MAG TPA: DUF2934 domain-containing protein [Blastocatellia bacterium]|jgi:hypothetical protein|nr:DUF2934 domain-containing protein [Blastocatellia bacterium]
MPKTARRKNATAEVPVSAPSEEEAPLRGEPSTEEIARRAYEIFLERGGAHGCDSDDWLQAELELRAKSK